MSAMAPPIYKYRFVNGWWLFGLISVPMSIATVIAMLGVDVTTGEGISAMIGYSVRLAVPFIFLVTGISAAHKLFSTPLTGWLLRNRKYLGLCFAVAMGWQGLFIAIMSLYFSGYYYEEVFYLRDELEGSVGYIFLAAMVVTSFRFGRRLINPQQWRLLHISGLYFLWAYPFSVYWWNLYYYPNPGPMDYAFYAFGFTAFALRIAAWGKQRVRSEQGDISVINKMLGGTMIAVGLVAAVTGLQWQDRVSTFLTGPDWSANLELWLPYWPFEPFLPLMVIGLGVAVLTTRSKRLGSSLQSASSKA